MRLLGHLFRVFQLLYLWIVKVSHAALLRAFRSQNIITWNFIMKLLTITLIALIVSFTTTIPALDKPASPELATLLKKIEKASDPENKAGKITNQIFTFEIEMPMAKIKFTSTTMFKAPNMQKIVTSVPNIMTETQVFDGTNGWKTNTRMGFQKITGAALQSLKFSTISGNKMLLEDKYARIEIAKEKTEVNGMQCLKLTCYPPAEYNLKPHILYVDINKYFMRKLTMTAITPMGEISSIIIINEYKKINGIYFPNKMQVEQIGMTLHMKLLSLKINQNIPDSEFEQPRELQTTTTTP